MNKDQTIYNLKLSELCMMIVSNRQLIKITGNLDISNEINDGKQLMIYSEESLDSMIPNRLLIESNIEFVNFSQYFESNLSNSGDSHRFECLVDLSYLHDFNFYDLNLRGQHDIIEFYGYKDSTSTINLCKFKALYYRIIARTNLTSYYKAIQVQTSYINKKLNALQNDL